MDGNAIAWASREFRHAEFGDVRRVQRLIQVATGMARQVGSAISQSCGPTNAQAVSRLFACREVTVESVLASHIKETVKRCTGVDRVLAIQDTTILDFTSHKALQGTGPINTGANSRGLLMHSVLACTKDRLPLGILDEHIWARPVAEHGKSSQRATRAVEEKESSKWFRGLEKTQELLPVEIPVVVIGDCESDIYGLFTAPRRQNCDLVVRSYQNRCIDSDDENQKKLEDAIEHQEMQGTYLLNVPARAGHKGRQATMGVKSIRVRLKRPAILKKTLAEPYLEVFCIRACEMDAPAADEGLEWTLLTTLPVESLADAIDVLEMYSVRWVIEEFHRTLKSGCNVEGLQMETLAALLPGISLLSVIAWRVLYLSRYARVYPDSPAQLVCTAAERMIVEHWLQVERKRVVSITTVRDFVRGVAMLGGFIGRTGDKEPGVKTLWQGVRRLDDLMLGYTLATQTR